METGRIIPGQSNPPTQITGAQSKSGEEAFHDLAKSDGYDEESLKSETSKRTRLTRTKKGDKTQKKHSHLFLVSDEDSEEPVYRTVMVDGQLFTLRLLAVA